MPSVIEICNLALSAIGQGIINALDEHSPQAEACSLHYESARDAVLREFPGTFLIRLLNWRNLHRKRKVGIMPISTRQMCFGCGRCSKLAGIARRYPNNMKLSR